MPVRDIAEWFGLSYSYFKRVAKQKYEELKQYCDYDKLHGKILIKEVHCEEYVGVKQESKYKMVEKFVRVHWRVGEPDSATRLAALFQLKHPNLIADSTCYAYVLRARKLFWGDPGDPDEHGIYGDSQYKFVKMYYGEDGPAGNLYVAMNQEEREICNRIKEMYYPQERNDIVLEKLVNGEWSGEKASKFMIGNEKTPSKQKYLAYIRRLKTELGCDWMVVATVVEDGVIFIYETDEKGVTHCKTINMTMDQYQGLQ